MCSSVPTGITSDKVSKLEILRSKVSELQNYETFETELNFLENIARAQNRIAKNGNNNFTINADTIFPMYSKYLKSVFKEYVTI